MTKTIFLTSLLFLSTPSWAGDIGKARLLYENRLLDDAKRELVEVASSSSAPEEAAEALHLLGSIAIDEKRYDSAIRTWEDLLQRFPETRNAAEVSGKIALARLLLEQDSSGAAASKSSESAIVVTGIGTETEFVNQAVTEIMNLLASKGVRVVRAPAGISSVPELLSASGQADGVLVMALRFGYMENLRAMCHGPDGKLLWEEKASGSMGFTKAGITQGLIERISRKVEPHIGGPCLPNRNGAG